MREDKLDRWGDVASHDIGAAAYNETMQAVQEEMRQESLRRLDERLARQGSDDDPA